jgi:GNAT superfamily N-acetyltransferase
MFPSVVTDLWLGPHTAGASLCGSDTFVVTVDPDLPEDRRLNVLKTTDGKTYVLLTPAVAAVLGLAAGRHVDELLFQQRLAAAGITLNGADHLFYYPNSARAELLAEPDDSAVRQLTQDDAAVFAAFEAEAPPEDLDNAYVELDHWAVFGAFAGTADQTAAEAGDGDQSGAGDQIAAGAGDGDWTGAGDQTGGGDPTVAGAADGDRTGAGDKTGAGDGAGDQTAPGAGAGAGAGSGDQTGSADQTAAGAGGGDRAGAGAGDRAGDGGWLGCAASMYPWGDAPVADLGVLTLPRFRGQGYGRRVVRAMSRYALARGYEPQYRCQLDNHASVALAGSAGLVPFGTWDIVAPDPDRTIDAP